MAREPFEASVVLHESIVEVVLVGELDVLSVPRFLAALDEAWSVQAAQLVIDLSELTYIDLRGVDALADAARSTRRKGIDFQMRHHTPAVERLAELLHVAEQVLVDHVLGED